MSKAEPAEDAASGPAYRIPRDEEVVAAIVRVILREGPVASQRRFTELVARTLRRRNAGYRVSGERVRVLALKSGLVGVNIRARHSGEAPELAECPVCGGRLARRANRTLHGGEAHTGYRCARCPWWTGRDYRVPGRYAFFPIMERPEAGGEQLTFRGGTSGHR